MKKLFAAFTILSLFSLAACHNSSSSTSQETKEEAMINTPQSEHAPMSKEKHHSEHSTAKPDSANEHH